MGNHAANGANNSAARMIAAAAIVSQGRAGTGKCAKR